MPNPPLTTLTRRALLALACVGPLAARASYQVREWPAGQPTPALQLSDLDDKRWTLEPLRGRAVLLNFWATWCEPCRAEMPSLQALARRHDSDGLTVVTVNYRESEPAIRRFVDANKIMLPVLLDRDGAAARAWTPRVFPSTVLIDRSGRPRRVVVGEIDWAGDEARRLIEELLKPMSRAS